MNWVFDELTNTRPSYSVAIGISKSCFSSDMVMVIWLVRVSVWCMHCTRMYNNMHCHCHSSEICWWQLSSPWLDWARVGLSENCLVTQWNAAVCFCLTYLHSIPSANRQDSQLLTSAVIVDLGIGCPIYATVYCWQLSISRRRGTNMEQFASRSDVIKFPANLQNQSKISFILGVISIALSVWSALAHFHFKCNVI